MIFLTMLLASAATGVVPTEGLPLAPEPKTAEAVIAADRAWEAAEMRGDAAYVDWLLLPAYLSVRPDGTSYPKSVILRSTLARADPTKAARIAADHAAWMTAHPLRGDVPIMDDTAVLPQPDPYGPAPTRAAQRLAYAAERGGEAEDISIERWLARHPDAPLPERAMLAHRLCLNYGVLVGGERRASACRLSVDLSGDPEDKSDLAISEAFRREPPIKAIGFVTVPMSRSRLGLLSIDVLANNVVSPWLVDSGAEITTIPETTAVKMGVRMVEGAADVGTSTDIRVNGRLGMIDKLAIGKATVTHIPVLVLPDAMLRLNDNQVIPGILGLPVLAAFRRASWLDGGSRLSLGRSASDAHLMAARKGWRVYWHEDGVGVPLTTDLGTRGAHLDTGATSSQLSPSGLKLLTPAQAATAIEHVTHTGGAGGIVEGKAKILPELNYMLAGTPIHAEKLTINNSPNGAGTVGSDALAQLDVFAIDFDAMTLTAVRRTR